jgi:hypothetical protein
MKKKKSNIKQNTQEICETGWVKGAYYTISGDRPKKREKNNEKNNS